jgi:hypothetical protein
VFVPLLAVFLAADVKSLPGSVAAWVLVSKLAMDLVARERVVPTITRRGGRIEARWAAALAGSEDAAKVAALARSIRPAAHAVPASRDRSGTVWAPDALLRASLGTDGFAGIGSRLLRLLATALVALSVSRWSGISSLM